MKYCNLVSITGLTCCVEIETFQEPSINDSLVISEEMENRDDFLDYVEKEFQAKKENGQVYSYPEIPRNIQLIEMDQARNIIFKFITEKKTPSVCHYGSSSWGMVGHNLFYDRDGILYGFYGRTLPEYDMTVFTLRRHIIEDMFDRDDPRREIVEKLDL
jgi:hypothetical protein